MKPLDLVSAHSMIRVDAAINTEGFSTCAMKYGL